MHTITLFSGFSLTTAFSPMLEQLVNHTQNPGLRRGPLSLRNFDNIWTNIHQVMSDMNYGNCQISHKVVWDQTWNLQHVKFTSRSPFKFPTIDFYIFLRLLVQFRPQRGIRRTRLWKTGGRPRPTMQELARRLPMRRDWCGAWGWRSLWSVVCNLSGSERMDHKFVENGVFRGGPRFFGVWEYEFRVQMCSVCMSRWSSFFGSRVAVFESGKSREFRVFSWKWEWCF